MANYDYSYQYPPQAPPQAPYPQQQPTAPDAYGGQGYNNQQGYYQQGYPPASASPAAPPAPTSYNQAPQYTQQDPYPQGQYQGTSAPGYSSSGYSDPNAYSQPPSNQYAQPPSQDPYGGYQQPSYNNVSTDYQAYPPQDGYGANSGYPSYDQYSAPPAYQQQASYGGYSNEQFEPYPPDPPKRAAAPPARKKEPEPDIIKGADGTERFRCTVIPSDDAEPETVVVQVGLDGVHVLDDKAKRTMRIYPLENISRWALREPTVLTFWTKPSKQEECTVRIMAAEKATRTILDTLTCCCLQLCELQPQGEGDDDDDDEEQEEETQKTRSWSLFGRGEASGSASTEPDDDVAFWVDPEHEGFLTKQGEHIKTWRRRWFILKGGKIFWFKESDVTLSSKPRGIIKLADIKEVNLVSGNVKITKGYPFEILLNDGSVQYFIADTDTEQMAWMAEIEQKAKEARGGKSKAGGSKEARLSHAAMAAQLKEGMDRLSINTTTKSSSSSSHSESYSAKTPTTPPTAPPQPVQYPWAMTLDNYGKPYYYNQITGATQWDAPN
mmetsp:Transcript_3744/g.4185  ORF Transcript_3744/g.4185 Transcript_3744/m.4185 type:complete len:551 (+) Transcript_3744:84-1736(+)|eukprot:CAMPEP_0197846962 /NCGR_PEP_ID=MMETSP1438-20131217/4744_1 /TAXON_ID=1461541 /ORGANISM="Pterosperma sp., Strain CCMP1384" /LENGTH=550 /DNA_ID=CAMNT_0043458753 /DNA_START=81 /DNA_END=1733 /DNA_ORIENTATION=+